MERAEIEAWYRLHPAVPRFWEGYFFASTLEARWAYFFDYLDIPYDYEKARVGFKIYLEVYTYTPDFFLPELGIWVEVKPGEPFEIEYQKAKKLGEVTKQSVYFLLGGFRYPFKGAPASHWKVYPEFESHQMWCECSACGFIGLACEGWAERLPCRCLTDNEVYTGDSPRIVEAIHAASDARFNEIFWEDSLNCGFIIQDRRKRYRRGKFMKGLL